MRHVNTDHLAPPFRQRIRWDDRGAPQRDGERGYGRLAGRAFCVQIGANGNPGGSAWTVHVWTGRDHRLDGTAQRATGHVGGIAAARQRARSLVREAVAIDRGDPMPGRPHRS